MCSKQYVSVTILIMAIASLMQACTYDVVPAPEDCSDPPVIQLISVEDASCGVASGAIQVQASAGEAPYVFRINGEGANAEGKFNNLKAGNYSVTVADNKGCTHTLEVQVNNQDGLNVTVETTEAACGTAEGSIRIHAEGGEEPYQFKLDQQAFQSSSTFAQLLPGSYEITAQDANGCEVVQSVQLSSGVAFEQVEAIIKTNCAVSNCHDGTTSPDFRQQEVIRQKAERIGDRTGNKTMPPSSSGKKLSDEEIAHIACWVGDGAPAENSQ